MYALIDGNDTMEEGRWRSSLTGEDMTSLFWDTSRGEPNGGSGENCVVLGTVNGLWHDIRCQRTFPLLCEAECNAIITSSQIEKQLKIPANLQNTFFLIFIVDSYFTTTVITTTTLPELPTPILPTLAVQIDLDFIQGK